jgi:hypothetical protein
MGREGLEVNGMEITQVSPDGKRLKGRFVVLK